jgi:ppGpp synthetase/RelA/SpoT-type nucleotidyltranferase
MMSSNQLPFSEVIEFYKSEETQSVLDQFLNQVEHFFKTNPTLKRAKAIHSIKARQKDPEHLRDKLLRKQSKGVIITKDTLFREITDLNGVRILHLYQQQFATVYKGNIIKNLIMDCQSYTKYRPNETTGGIFVSWRRKEELPTGA